MAPFAVGEYGINPVCTDSHRDISLDCRGTAVVVPPPFRPGNPALCGSCPLVTPYECRLGDLLLAGSFDRLPYNLYCVGGDVKPCSVQSNQSRL